MQIDDQDRINKFNIRKSLKIASRQKHKCWLKMAKDLQEPQFNGIVCVDYNAKSYRTLACLIISRSTCQKGFFSVFTRALTLNCCLNISFIQHIHSKHLWNFFHALENL